MAEEFNPLDYGTPVKEEVFDPTEFGSPIEEEVFDPEGVGYDYETAKAAGLSADETGHWPSRDPISGMLLKGAGHETFEKTLRGEEEAGFEVYKGDDGRYYSREKQPPSVGPTQPGTYDRDWETFHGLLLLEAFLI